MVCSAQEPLNLFSWSVHLSSWLASLYQRALPRHWCHAEHHATPPAVLHSAGGRICLLPSRGQQAAETTQQHSLGSKHPDDGAK